VEEWGAGNSLRSKGSSMRIVSKITALGAGVGLVVGAVVGGYMVRLSSGASERRIAEFERTLRADFDREARVEVETAVSLLRSLSDRAGRGEMTIADAKRTGANLVRDLRYGKDGYFWVDTVDGVNVVLLGRADEGKNRLDKVDSAGKSFVAEFLKNGRAGGGFTDYRFPRKEGGESLPKRAYTLEFAPFGWVVGTGNYVDDIDVLVEQGRRAARRERLGELGAIGLVVVVAAALAAALSIFIARSVARPLAFLVQESARLRQAVADGRLGERGEAAHLNAEFRPVVEGMNETMDAFTRPIEVTAAYVDAISRGEIPPKIGDA
jgi:methyl-accepting chemotaxis protein